MFRRRSSSEKEVVGFCAESPLEASQVHFCPGTAACLQRITVQQCAPGAGEGA